MASILGCISNRLAKWNAKVIRNECIIAIIEVDCH